MMPKLSEAQQAVIARFVFVGAQEIRRQPGGFWTIGSALHEEWYASTPTVRALAKAGLIIACNWGGDEHGSWVTVYRLTPAGREVVGKAAGRKAGR